MSTATTQRIFSDTELREDEPNRPFRVSALFSFLFGVISSGALASTSLLFLPLTAILLGLFAIRPSRVDAAPPIGRGFAFVGMALAIFFGSWSLGYDAVQRRVLQENGVKFAQYWLTTLRHGELEFSYELTLLAPHRQLDTMPLDQYYAPSNEMAFEQLDTFRSKPCVQAVVNASKDPQWQFAGLRGRYREYSSDFVVMLFNDLAGEVKPIQLTLCCTPTITSTGVPDPAQPFQWNVAGFHYAPDSVTVE